MSNDANLLDLSQDAFAGAVDEALKLHKQFRLEGDLSVLATSKLADSSLVLDCLLKGEPSTIETRGRNLQGILHWGVDKLSPGGAHSFVERQWQLYNSLFYPYLAEGEWVDQGVQEQSGLAQVEQADIDSEQYLLELEAIQPLFAAKLRWTFNKLSEQMALSERALFRIRKQALNIVASRLHQELSTPQELDLRRKYVVEHRYRALRPDEQNILHLATILRKPLPLQALQQLSAEVGVADPIANIRGLLDNWFVQQEDSG
ncbi:MAG: hypothetical protein AAF702_28995 [Chloroflexota bacterium]